MPVADNIFYPEMFRKHSCCSDILSALAKKCLYTALVILLAPTASGWTAGRAVRTSRIRLRKAVQAQPGQRWSFLGRTIRSAPTLYVGINAGRALEESAPSRSGTSREQSPAEARPTTSQEVIQGPVPAFEFHSGFWINLHHFLYQQARLYKSTPQSIPRPALKLEGSGTKEPATSANSLGPTPGSGQAPTEALTEEERQSWAAALDYYAGNLSGHDLFVNGDMVQIKNRLAELETCPNLSGRVPPQCVSGLRPELIAALEVAAPVYRARWWAEHDRANRSWIASVSLLVRQMGGRLAQQLASVYQTDWPAGRLRVDVTFNAGPFGAYTSLDPLHLTISSTDPRNQGPAALEVLFHEASHALAGAVRDLIVRECRQRGKPIPRYLWHALLFYTTGEIVKRTLAKDFSVPDAGARGNYTPYAYKFGLYARGWQNYQRVLERYWQPYLDGKADFDGAVARLVSAL